MKSQEIAEGVYYRDAVGFVFRAEDIVRVGNIRRVRWTILSAPAKKDYRGPRSLGERGVWNLTNFASWMVTSARRRCKFCGCSDAHACAGGCTWTEWNVCSQCTPTRRAADALFERAEREREATVVRGRRRPARAHTVSPVQGRERS